MADEFGNKPKANRGGNPNWVKGKSGNPSGRQKTPREIVAAFQCATLDAAKKLIALMDCNDPHIAVKACCAVLDRGIGKVPDKLQVEDNRNDITDADLYRRVSRIIAKESPDILQETLAEITEH